MAFTDQNNEKAVFTETKYIDNEQLAIIAEKKTNFWLNLDNDTDPKQAGNDLTKLLYLMNDIIGKYSENEVKTYVVQIGGKSYNWYDILALSNVNYGNQILLIRLFAQKAFSIYNHFSIKLGQEIPMVRWDIKKKITYSIFSLLPNIDQVYEDIALHFKPIKKGTNKWLDYYAFNLYYAHKVRQSTDTIIFGWSQSGKSTELLWLAKRFYEYRQLDLNNEIRENLLLKDMLNFIEEGIIYSREQDIEPFKKIKDDLIARDEGYFTIDKRRSMNSAQIESIATDNAFGDKHNGVINIMQNFSDIDERVKAKCNIIGVFELGTSFLFMQIKNFPIFKQDMFERLIKNPYLLKNKVIGKHTLQSMTNYSGTLCWASMEFGRWGKGINLEIFKSYRLHKEKWQSKIKQLAPYQNPLIDFEMLKSLIQKPAPLDLNRNL